MRGLEKGPEMLFYRWNIAIAVMNSAAVVICTGPEQDLLFSHSVMDGGMTYGALSSTCELLPID